jgi:hypothetical protein
MKKFYHLTVKTLFVFVVLTCISYSNYAQTRTLLKGADAKRISLGVIESELGYQIDLSSSNEGLYLIKAVNEKNQEFSTKFMKY